MRISDWSSDVCSSDLQFAWLAPAFTDRGFNFAAVGYPLAPEARLAGIVASCRAAVHWLLAYPSGLRFDPTRVHRSEEHTSELQSLMRISYAVFCLKTTPKSSHQTPNSKYSRLN